MIIARDHDSVVASFAGGTSMFVNSGGAWRRHAPCSWRFRSTSMHVFQTLFLFCLIAGCGSSSPKKECGTIDLGTSVSSLGATVASSFDSYGSGLKGPVQEFRYCACRSTNASCSDFGIAVDCAQPTYEAVTTLEV